MQAGPGPGAEVLAESGPEAAEKAKASVRAVFNAAAEHFDDEPLSFWDHFGRRTVELAPVRAGDAVLDVCCGTGASALPAAERAGPGGRVLGVDLAERLLGMGRAKAAERGLANVELAVGDMLALDVPDASYDVVICVFGVFFVPDMQAAMIELWRAVRPGGTLAVTTWGPRVLEPASTIFWETVETERPDLRPAQPAWARVATPEAMADLFGGAGAPAPAIDEETLVHPMDGPGFWTVVLGSGYRRTADALGPEAAERVRIRLLERMQREGIADVAADAIYGRTTKIGAGTG